MLLWAQGVAVNSGFNVNITEPDVSPLQLQGPTSSEIMIKLFGEDIKNLKYYWFNKYELDGIPLIVSRTGWSSEFGYELFLRDGSKGDQLYEKIMEAGKEYGLQPGHTSSIRRIEGGMLSYHADADINTIKNFAGGDTQYDNIIAWANTNLDAKSQEAFDSIVNSGSVDAIKIAVSGLKSQYENANGFEGKMYTGKAPKGDTDVFRSQAELVAAMSDKRYDRDPAYRQDIIEKLDRSNLDF